MQYVVFYPKYDDCSWTPTSSPSLNIVNIVHLRHTVWLPHNFVSHHTYQITSNAMACHGTSWHQTTVRHVSPASLFPSGHSKIATLLLCR